MTMSGCVQKFKVFELPQVVFKASCKQLNLKINEDFRKKFVRHRVQAVS